MSIRPSTTEQDWHAALHVMQTAFREYETTLDPPSSMARETVASLRERAGDGTLLLAEREGALVGCVLVRPEDGFLYIGRLAVLPAARGAGVGGALLAAAEDAARQRGIACARLGVRLALPELIARYARAGYRVISEHAHAGYAHPTWITMEKHLSAGDV